MRLAALASLVLLGVLACAAFANVLTAYDPIISQSYAAANQGPSAAHWFGTDYLGRDLMSRLMFGSRVSLTVGAAAVSIGVVFGVTVGLVSGQLGGLADAVLMRIADTIWAFPGLMLALAITAALGPGVPNVIAAIGVVNIPYFARLARGSTLATREMDYVTAARATGASLRRLLVRHILPNIAAPIIVQGSLAFGTAIIAEASLSFLGVGVQPPTPSWGIEMRSGYQYLEVNPAAAIFPGLVIFVVVLALNFLGDALRSALDPRLQTGASSQSAR